MAFSNPNITATSIEATEFMDLSRRFRVTGVPKTVVNDSIEIVGALPEPDFIEMALHPAGEARRAGAVRSVVLVPLPSILLVRAQPLG